MPPVINVACLKLQVANLFRKSVGIARDTTQWLKACHKPLLSPIFACFVYLKCVFTVIVLKYMAFNLVYIHHHRFLSVLNVNVEELEANGNQ